MVIIKKWTQKKQMSVNPKEGKWNGQKGWESEINKKYSNLANKIPIFGQSSTYNGLTCDFSAL